MTPARENGNWECIWLKIARKEEANFPNATLIEEEVLLPSAKVGARLSPVFTGRQGTCLYRRP